MITSIHCACLADALSSLAAAAAQNEADGVKTVVFCEDRLSLAAERAVCSAVGGTFLTSVYTFARFLSSEKGGRGDVLSAQGSAMAVRAIIEGNSGELRLFKRLSAPAAAQSVYDTIALFYSSRIRPEEVKRAAEGEKGLLSDKLHDIALIYEEYEKYLENFGKEDRNRYLKELAPAVLSSGNIARSRVIFLGFQAFTRASAECVRAAMQTARDTSGFFICGSEDIYVNEACALFEKAGENFGGCRITTAPSGLIPEADALRKSLYDPESYYRAPVKCDNVRMFSAESEEEELEFVAAAIKKHVAEGERYSKISVMIPDMDGCKRLLSRVFAQYRIPYFADRRIPLSEHPLCAFVNSYLSCLNSGCVPRDVDAVVASPYFPADRADKDCFRTYALRFAAYRGGVLREPDGAILSNCGMDERAINSVRETFIKGLSVLRASLKGGKSAEEKTDESAPAAEENAGGKAFESAGENAGEPAANKVGGKGVRKGIFGGIRDLLEQFGVEEKLAEIAERFKDTLPAEAALSARAFGGVMSVLSEAEAVAGGLPPQEAAKILKSGFAAMRVSIIPPKADAVFVGDLTATANTGSDVVFAVRLTGDAPPTFADCSLLTDREISALERANVEIAPKIRQVNARNRETAALNLCAFRKKLYLTYPAKKGNDECGASEILAYASAAFETMAGERLAPIPIRRRKLAGDAFIFYGSEPVPALKLLSGSLKRARPAALSALYSELCARGFGREADLALKKRQVAPVQSAGELYPNSKGGVSPTALEAYFMCPFLAFMRRGLKVHEREEGAFRAVDTGNFIHAVLEKTASECAAFTDGGQFFKRAYEVAEELLSRPPYSALSAENRGKYVAEALKTEAAKTAEGMFEQIHNSRFAVAETEHECTLPLFGNISLTGRIDRVDEYGDMVRVIDYKTGNTDFDAKLNYAGVKLQLPLYLLSASRGKRAVGAYYFPAQYSWDDAKEDGVFRLKGFMDSGEDVATASDITYTAGKKSKYIEVYTGRGSKPESLIPREQFGYLLRYSLLLAESGAREMLGGNVAPSPSSKKTCESCKMGGACGFALGRDGGEREVKAVKFADLARIAGYVPPPEDDPSPKKSKGKRAKGADISPEQPSESANQSADGTPLKSAGDIPAGLAKSVSRKSSGDVPQKSPDITPDKEEE